MHNKPIIGFKIDVVVESDEAGFHAYCPALKGLHTYGHTEKKALQNARYAAIAYLQSLIKNGDSIPIGIIIHEETQETKYSLAKSANRHTEDLKVPCAI